MRSIQSPKLFTDELLLKRPKLAIMTFWIFGFSIYPIILIICGTKKYTGTISYRPSSMRSFVDIIFWFAPLTAITIMSVYLWLLLKKREKKKKSVKKRKSKFQMSSRTRFFIMIFAFWIQWFVFYILNFIELQW